jgi:transcriptional regulator with XRE-family HTH domain
MLTTLARHTAIAPIDRGIRGPCFPFRVTTSRHSQRTIVGRRTHELVVATGAEIRRLRLDAGVAQRSLAKAAEIDPGFLSQIERGLREPSLAVLVAIAEALGGSMRLRVYPGTGPRIRDPIQARIVEALLPVLDPRWARHLEVPVYRPVRGVIDLLLYDRTTHIAGVVEVQSELRRLEQQIRWSHEKADALPSATIWRQTEPPDRVDQVLILRNTRANRDIVVRFEDVIRTAYPAETSAAVAALTTADGPWPGSALLWADVSGDATTILDHPPRTVRVGRP